ncbi:type II toxin-antitoxin system VapC family toxin [Treponema vincentii]|uniref:type II toxin-antitoxin system VapC family toxin n=1 Tax=Treponema vincentii TaxID=69710 RepID=UPI0020A5F97D|nr:type II toxin-antitoxin system VapC family toxin [Treponema vincentii]UTC46878.1 type II toxin-antitoxin system VapC family toxin [Treponema vincentii]
MKILLDTHYLLWAFIDTSKISQSVYHKLLADENEVFYSQASLWEISIKFNMGKLSLKGMKPEEFYEEVANSFLKCRAFSNDELITFYKLPIEHKDSFDRIMIWQSIKSDYYFLSVDRQITKYERYGLKILT